MSIRKSIYRHCVQRSVITRPSKRPSSRIATMGICDIPSSSSTVSVSVIDSTAWAYNVPCADLFSPPMPGLTSLDLCSYSFLISHGEGNNSRHVLFDLGIRKDWQNLVPSMVSRLKEWGTRVQVEKHVSDILQDNKMDLRKIEAIIWSHLHWDHTGNPTTFPSSTKLIYGPGIKEKYMPGWPQIHDAGFRESDIAGREVIGLSHSDFNLMIGGFPAIDYFKDGSFYILDAPGHSLGHLNALARTTTDPDTFIFIAADSLHLGGEIRPSAALPLPDPVDVPGIEPRPCPAEKLLQIHPHHSATLPFLGLDPCFPEHLEDAEKTIGLIQRFDADERILVLFTHDTSIYTIIEFYPTQANDWKDKGWKAKGRWTFVTDLQRVALKTTH